MVCGLDTAAVTILMAGADDIFDATYAYAYEDGNVEFLYPGGSEVCSSGRIKGKAMELEDGTGSLWGSFYRK